MAATPAPLNKQDLPEAFGVFKPVGHVVMAFKDHDDLDAVRRELDKRGYPAAALVSYSPAEMKAQIERELAQASGAAGFGYELNLLKLHRRLADEGHEWLVVRAPQEPQWQDVAALARAHRATAAHRYGRLVVEDLLVQPQQQAGL